MRLLVSGFEPFGGSAINPSEQVVRRLSEVHLPNIELVTEILPEDHRRGPEQLLRTVEETHPGAVLCLGEDSGGQVLTIERLAINLLNFSTPDNQGAKVEDEPILPGGPAAYFVSLPVRKMLEAARAVQVPAELSLSAGSYLCNQVLYTLLHHLSRREMGIPAGFIHLPPLPEQAVERKKSTPSMSLETSLRGINAVIEVLRDTIQATELASTELNPVEEIYSGVTIRRATVDDIEALVELRLALQKEIGAQYDESPQEGAGEANRGYLEKSLPGGEFLAWVAEANGELVACSGLVIYSRMPGMHGLSSREAYVMNMYTQPKYRHKGIATALLDRTVQYTREAGARRVWLRATDMGRPVYEKYGFQPMESAMQLKLE
jgi:pyroglutamyl-peptidase